jgi:hypothetical protein
MAGVPTLVIVELSGPLGETWHVSDAQPYFLYRGGAPVSSADADEGAGDDIRLPPVSALNAECRPVHAVNGNHLNDTHI